MLSRRDEFAKAAMHAMTTRRQVEAGEVADGAYAIADAMEARAQLDEGQDDAPRRCIETMVDQHAEIDRLRAELARYTSDLTDEQARAAWNLWDGCGTLGATGMKDRDAAIRRVRGGE
jgi:hypothetical protein